MIKLQNLTQVLENLYPLDLAESWDPVGLHFGQLDSPINKVLVSLDVRPATVQEAIEYGADTMIVHHPPIFSPISRFDTQDPQIAMYAEIIRAGIQVYAMHTNLDKATNGMNDWLTGQLGLENVQSLDQVDDQGRPGLGRIGDLPQALDRADLINFIKETYQLDPILVIEAEPKASYQRIAVVGGSGADYYPLAQAEGADVFITGDISYHKAHDAYESDLMTLDLGHYIEHIYIEKMTGIIENLIRENGWDLQVLASQVSTDPYHYE